MCKMICHKHKTVFIHVPKTAGSSIEKVLQKLVNGPHGNKVDEKRYFYGWEARHKIWLQHATIHQVNNIYSGDLSEYFKFGFVRSPWSRAVSDFIWLRRDQRIDGTLADYLLVQDGFKKIKKRQKKVYRLDHTLPQHEFLFDKNGTQLVDFIGRFENLQQDFNTVCDKIGIPRQQLPHTNKSKHKHYTKYYDEKTKQIVAEKYAKDIEYFGYEFGE